MRPDEVLRPANIMAWACKHKLDPGYLQMDPDYLQTAKSSGENSL